MPSFYEFFAGVGLARLGLGPQWRCVFANDIDDKKAEIYRENFGDDELVVDDIRNIRDLPPNADVAWASFPCQDLSLAGWRRGMFAGRSGAFWPFWERLNELLEHHDRPPLVVIENVVGLLHSPDFIGLCESLSALDMQFGALVMDAVRFVPQSRARVFLVAVSNSVSTEEFTVSAPHDSTWVTPALLEAYERLPVYLQEPWRWWDVQPYEREITAVDSIIEDDPTGVDWNSDVETQRLLDMMSDVNRDKVNRVIQSGRPAVGFVYKRIRQGLQRAEVRFDGIAGCLRMPTGGSSRQTIMFVRDGHIRTRLLSPREAARLMGVPDTFWLPDRYNQAYGAMGDGVAVPVVSWLARNLLDPLTNACRITGIRARGLDIMQDIAPVLEAQRTVAALAEQWRNRVYA